MSSKVYGHIYNYYPCTVPIHIHCLKLVAIGYEHGNGNGGVHVCAKFPCHALPSSSYKLKMCKH